MFQGNIRKRVIAVIEKKIQDAEKAYAAKCTTIELEAKKQKAQALEDAVNGIVSKVI